MKHKFSILTISFLFSIALANAQHHNRQEMHKKVEAYKVAYLTEKLHLTPEEAQKFWPVYKDFHKKDDSLRRDEQRAIRKSKASIENMTDKELEIFVNQRIIYSQQKLDLKKHYHQKLKEIIPIKKIAQLYIAEREFKKYLLQKLGGRGHGHGKGYGYGRGSGPIHDDF